MGKHLFLSIDFSLCFWRKSILTSIINGITKSCQLNVKLLWQLRSSSRSHGIRWRNPPWHHWSPHLDYRAYPGKYNRKPLSCPYRYMMPLSSFRIFVLVLLWWSLVLKPHTVHPRHTRLFRLALCLLRKRDVLLCFFLREFIVHYIRSLLASRELY